VSEGKILKRGSIIRTKKIIVGSSTTDLETREGAKQEPLKKDGNVKTECF